MKRLLQKLNFRFHLEEVALRTARRGSGSGPALLKAKQSHIKTDSPRDSLRLTPSKSETVQKIYGLNDQEVTKLQKSLLAIRQLRMTKEDPESKSKTKFNSSKRVLFFLSFRRHPKSTARKRRHVDQKTATRFG